MGKKKGNQVMIGLFTPPNDTLACDNNANE